MAAPIAAGTIVTTKSALSGFELENRRPIIGRCESAIAGAPGSPPTDVVVAWEDGTRETYAVAIGLASVGLPSSASLLGTVMQFLPTTPPLFEAGTRLRGPVVMHAEYFEANGDPLVGSNEVATLKTRFGYASVPVVGLVPVPGA